MDSINNDDTSGEIVSDKITSTATRTDPPSSLGKTIITMIPCHLFPDTPSTARMTSWFGDGGSPDLSVFETRGDVLIVPPSTIMYDKDDHRQIFDETTMNSLMIPSRYDHDNDNGNRKKRNIVELTTNNKSNQHTQSSEKQPLVVSKLQTLTERQQQQQCEWIALFSLLAVIFVIVLFFVPN